MKKIFCLLALFISTTQISFGQENSGYTIIEQEGMDVVYAGIPMSFTAVGGGSEYVSTSATPSTVTASANQVGQYITVQCIGKDKKGKEVVLGSKKYLVKPTPTPNLYLGDYEDGSILDSIPAMLKVSYGDNIPFSPSKGNFNITQYSIVVSGLKGSLEGEGSEISELHLEALKAISKGNKITIQVKYSGSSNGLITSMFEL